ncbi:hypothetical protein ACFL35_03560 [Candidatus Riflebacteria bacterium]
MIKKGLILSIFLYGFTTGVTALENQDAGFSQKPVSENSIEHPKEKNDNADISDIVFTSRARVKKFLARGKLTIFEFGAPW